jgi:hypothetical protein
MGPNVGQSFAAILFHCHVWAGGSFALDIPDEHPGVRRRWERWDVPVWADIHNPLADKVFSHAVSRMKNQRTK